jgi:uncharacterized cupredoxin-like copper-binding protein
MNMRYHGAALALTLALASGASFATGSHAGGHDESAVGAPGQAAKVSKTVKIAMTDNMRFSPAEISVKAGETVRFLVSNSGQIKHELVLGTAQELKEHYALMLKNPGMEHADANQMSVAPGQVGEVIWRFTKPGKVDFACLQPGHYDAGMKGAVQVAGAGTKHR